MKNKIKIAVLIACHNRLKKTKQCLKALFCQKKTRNVNLEVFLVDDGSTDGTSKFIKKRYPNINLIKANGDLYWAKSTNLAWRVAIKSKKNFDYFLLLNNDTYLYEDAFNELFFKNKHMNSIIVGSCCDPITKKRTYGGVKLNRNLLQPFKFKMTDINGMLQEVHIANGNVLLISKRIVKRIGILDGNFEHAFADIEYSLKAVENKIKLFLTRKHVAECVRLKEKKVKHLSISNQIKNIFHIKKKPIKSLYRLYSIHGGHIWIIPLIFTYLKSIFLVIYKKQ